MAGKGKQTEKMTVPEMSGTVIVTALAGASHMKAGKDYPVSAVLAKTLIKKGFVELKKS